jgi:hypothetical protein
MIPGGYQLFVSAPGMEEYAAYMQVSIKPEDFGAKPAAFDLGEIRINSPLSVLKNP